MRPFETINRGFQRMLSLVIMSIALFAPFQVAPAFVLAQAQSSISCEPIARTTPTIIQTVTPRAEVSDAGNLEKIQIGYVPITVFAPIYVAKELGYYAEEGLDVELEAFPGGSDLVILTASGQLDAAFAGAGPPLFNGVAQGLPIRIIAPGHTEGDPVATPLMISKRSCDEGTITAVADLKGKKVSINARGSIEYLLNAALSTGGLTIDDIELQILPFPDAVAALQTGAVDAALISEPLATKAEQDGIAIRLAPTYPVHDIQPTAVIGNERWLNDHPDQAQGFVTAYLRASRLLAEGGLNDPAVQAIIEQYTGVPATLAAAAIHPVFSADGQISFDSLTRLQTFLRDRGQLDYDTDLDPQKLVDTTFVTAAMTEIEQTSS